MLRGRCAADKSVSVGVRGGVVSGYLCVFNLSV